MIKTRPYLTWDINAVDTEKLSENSLVERIINYGNWDDVLQTIAILEIEKTADIFAESIKFPRNNYRPQTVNFFKLFFQKHAPGSS